LRLFHSVITLIVSNNLCFIVFKFSQTYLKNSKDSKSVLIFSLALVVVEFLANL
jgi:hypothetical protein